MTPEFKAFVEALKRQAENSLTILRSGTPEFAYYAGRKDTCDALLLSEDLGGVCDVPEWPVGLQEMMAEQNSLLDRLRKMELRKDAS